MARQFPVLILLLREAVGEVRFVVAIRVVWHSGQLVSARIHDRTHQMLQIEVVAHEVLTERIEQRFIHRRVRRPEIVERID